MRPLRMLRSALCVAAVNLPLALLPSAASAQNAEEIAEVKNLLERHIESLRHQLDVVNRRIDDVMFFHRVGDIADIDLVAFTGPPDRLEWTDAGAGALEVMDALQEPAATRAAHQAVSVQLEGHGVLGRRPGHLAVGALVADDRPRPDRFGLIRARQYHARLAGCIDQLDTGGTRSPARHRGDGREPDAG